MGKPTEASRPQPGAHALHLIVRLLTAVPAAMRRHAEVERRALQMAVRSVNGRSER
jgi:hypothetical protein